MDQLWTKSIGAVVPPEPFTLKFGPGFPDRGTVGIISGLDTATSQTLCVEAAGVDTAGVSR